MGQSLSIPDGSAIRSYRFQRGFLTQEALSEKSGLNKKTIENIEDSKPVRPGTLSRVARALEVEIEHILRPATRSLQKSSVSELMDRLALVERRQQAFETYIRAEELRKVGWLDEAEFLYSEVARLLPPGHEHAQNALIGIAKIQRQRRDYRGALKTLEDLLKNNPANDRARYNLACYLNLSGASKQDVLRELKQIIGCKYARFYKDYAMQDPDLQNLWVDAGLQEVLAQFHSPVGKEERDS
jgi:transcriptional regulator with XRE-family HTH domain